MEKKMWKVWDEFLVDAWEKDGGMFIATLQFLMPYGISQIMLKAVRPEGFFAEIGIIARAPKIQAHLYSPVRAFFHQFFPVANELLWQGRKLEALKAMRQYRVVEEQMRIDKETKASKRDVYRKRSSSEFPLIPGTNAMHVNQARRSASDWNTVKPPCRQRRKYL